MASPENGGSYHSDGGTISTEATDRPERRTCRTFFLGFAHARKPSQAPRRAGFTEYAPGAAIGWHKDRSVFGDIVGISLLSPCTFRLRLSRPALGAAKSHGGAAVRVPAARACPHRVVSTVFPAWKAFAIRSRSATSLKGMHKHGPDIHLAEKPSADARHADG
jgi:hypothetical protein